MSAKPFIRRPIGTALLAIGIALAGIAAYFALPVAPLPRSTCRPSWSAPASPAPTRRPWPPPSRAAGTPARRHRRRVRDDLDLLARHHLRSSLQFDLSRSVEGAARDVQAAINAAGTDLPAGLPNPPYFSKFNPGDAPVLILAMTSDTVDAGAVYDAADSIVAPRIARMPGVSAGADPGRRAAGHPRHHRPGRGQGGRRRAGSDPPGDRREQRHPGDRADRRPRAIRRRSR